MSRIDIHNLPAKFSAALKRIEQSHLSAENKHTLIAYARGLQLAGIGLARIVKYLSTLGMIATGMGKDLATASREDLETFMFQFRARQDRSVWTKHDYAVALRRFYRWLEGNRKGVPERVAAISGTLPKKDQPRIKKSELLTEEDIEKLLQAAENPRDKALIALIWETGARIGEIGGLAIGDITFKERATSIDFHGKTGPRTVPVLTSTLHLRNWILNHPAGQDKAAPMWINLNRAWTHRHCPRPLGYVGLYKIFQVLFKRAGISKNFNPHLFRHSRATWCIEQGWSTQRLCMYFGWRQDSDMPAVYVSLDQNDLERAMFETYGLKSMDTPRPQAISCARCEAINPARVTCCYRCGMALNYETLLTMETAVKQTEHDLATLLRDPRVIRALKDVLTERSATAAANGETARQAAPQPPAHPGTTPPLPASTA